MSVFVFVLFLFFFWKELIQNAEDAGASQVKFLHDKHSYGKEKLHSQKLATFQVSFVKELAKNEQCRVSNSLYRDKHLGYFFFIFNYKVLTYNTYLQTMYGTYATNKTILYLQNNTYLQCEILTLLTILYTLLTIQSLQYLLTMRYLHH